MINGLPNGGWTAYFDNGNIQEKSLKKNGLLAGDFIGYHKDFANIPQKKCFYNNGNLEGEFNGYYPSGKQMNSYQYIGNKIQGVYYEYFDSDSLNLFIKGSYINDKKEGIWYTY